MPSISRGSVHDLAAVIAGSGAASMVRASSVRRPASGAWPDRNPDVGWVLIAAAIGGATLASVWPKHEPALGILAAVAGTLACVSLAWRRSRPLAVAVFTVTVAVFSPMTVAATILAVVNAAVSCSLATYVLLAAYVVVVAAAHVAFSLEPAGFLSDQLPAVWVLLPVTVLGLVARARRSRIESEQQQRVGRRAQPSAGGSRARCTTCSHTGSRS
jgi:hypothetical protein